MTCDGESLRQRAIEGDPALLGDIFLCFRDELLAFLRVRCGNRTDAEDATQDAFEAAARYLGSYRGEAGMRSWLYRLAASACTRMRRGQKNDPTLHRSIDEQDLDLPASAPDGAPTQLLELQLQSLREALEGLRPRDRAVLLLRDGEGMTAKEVADALELTTPAVKSRLFRARRAVRSALGEIDRTTG